MKEVICSVTSCPESNTGNSNRCSPQLMITWSVVICVEDKFICYFCHSLTIN